mmetsp:Transcript_7089/g.11441  ORF Transcript_7089/g.11441 Transcript_7089/m.11441 type:complete len:284 (-) Transcript_7089:270-1121(-)
MAQRMLYSIEQSSAKSDLYALVVRGNASGLGTRRPRASLGQLSNRPLFLSDAPLTRQQGPIPQPPRQGPSAPPLSPPQGPNPNPVRAPGVRPRCVPQGPPPAAGPERAGRHLQPGAGRAQQDLHRRPALPPRRRAGARAADGLRGAEGLPPGARARVRHLQGLRLLRVPGALGHGEGLRRAERHGPWGQDAHGEDGHEQGPGRRPHAPRSRGPGQRGGGGGAAGRAGQGGGGSCFLMMESQVALQQRVPEVLCTGERKRKERCAGKRCLPCLLWCLLLVLYMY